MLGHRIFSSVAMVAVLLAVFYFDRQLEDVDVSGSVFEKLLFGRACLPAGLLMWGGFSVLIVLAAREINEIFHAKGIATARWLIGAGGVGGCAIVYVVPSRLDPQLALAIAATGLLVLFGAALVRHSRLGCVEGAVAVASATVFGAVYLGLPPALFLAIRQSYGPWVVAAVIVVVKLCDVGAYFTGRAVGKHKLIPWLSPGKTWEGLAGGVAVSAVACWLLVVAASCDKPAAWWANPADRPGWVSPKAVGWWCAVLAGGAMGLVGQLSDLSVSFFKRDAGIKDSGDQVPGFGGLLDVLDSLMMVAPLAYWLLSLGAIMP